MKLGLGLTLSSIVVPTNSAFDPTTGLSGLTAWYDASDSASITTPTSNHVSQVNDKSGNGRHLVQATDANRPTYQTAVQNGHNSVRFVATTGEYLANSSALSAFISASQFEIFAALQITLVTTSAGDAAAYDNVQFVSDTNGYWGYGADATLVKSQAWHYDGAAEAADQTIVIPQLMVVSWRFDGTTIHHSINGGSESTKPSGNVGNVAGTLQMGRNYNGAHSFTGDLFEFLTCNVTQSTGARAACIAYLRLKWGI